MYKRTRAFVVIVGFFPFLALINFLLGIGYAEGVDDCAWLYMTILLAITSGLILVGDYVAYKSTFCPKCKKSGVIIRTEERENPLDPTDDYGSMNTKEVYIYQCECGNEWESKTKLEECIFKS